MGLDRNLHLAASRFEEAVDDLAARVTLRAQQEVAEFRSLEAPELWEAHRRVTRGSRLAQARHLRCGLLLPTSCPEPDAEAARLAAAGGLSIATVLHTYRIGHSVGWEGWLDAVESGGISEPDRKECLRAISRFVMAYDDRLMSLVTEEFGRPKDAAQFSPETKRMKLLRDLIDGSTDDLHGLDYDLELNHIGVIAWGPRARSALSDLASALDRRLVWAPAEDDLLMAWVGSSSPPNETHLRVVRGSRPTGHAQLAVGSPGDGLAGFRRTHREAGEAHVVAKRRPLPVTLYEDVALEAFALRDEPAAREFVEHALGPLHVNGKRGDDLPETLRAYFAAGQNASSAAAALGVHEHTVPRRLQKIEELIGCPINDRRAELELALRLEALLTHNWGSGYGKSRL